MIFIQAHIIVKVEIRPTNCFSRTLIWAILLFCNFSPINNIQCVDRKSWWNIKEKLGGVKPKLCHLKLKISVAHTNFSPTLIIGLFSVAVSSSGHWYCQNLKGWLLELGGKSSESQYSWATLSIITHISSMQYPSGKHRTKSSVTCWYLKLQMHATSIVAWDNNTLSKQKKPFSPPPHLCCFGHKWNNFLFQRMWYTMGQFGGCKWWWAHRLAVRNTTNCQ